MKNQKDNKIRIRINNKSIYFEFEKDGNHWRVISPLNNGSIVMDGYFFDGKFGIDLRSQEIKFFSSIIESKVKKILKIK